MAFKTFATTEFKPIASDGAAEDIFGVSVPISVDLALADASEDEKILPGSGKVGFYALEAQPGQATLISPSSTITENDPTYTWSAVEAATWYYHWVNNSTGNKIKKWYTADKANCGSGTGECSVTNTTELEDGSCKWWIQTWNDDGYGPWSDTMPFTVDTEQGLEFNLDFGQDGTYEDYWLLEPGETVFTDVYVSNVLDPGLRSMGIKIVYDSSWLEVGTGKEVYAVNWLINNTFQDVLGEIRMVGSVFLNPALPCNNIKLGTIEFNPVSMETTTLWLYDSAGGSFDDFVLEDGTVLDYQIEDGIPVATIETNGGSSKVAAKSDPSAQSVISSDIDRTDSVMGQPCIGDFDNDGDVDGSDFTVIAKDFGGKNGGSDYLCMGDLYNDDDVDGSDLATFAVDLGRTDCQQ